MNLSLLTRCFVAILITMGYCELLDYFNMKCIPEEKIKSLQDDERYAIRFANGAVPWWTGPGNHYGVNIIGDITVK